MSKISIASSASLVELTISVWTGRKQDKGSADELATDKNASTGVVSVSKALLGQCSELSAIAKLASEARVDHYNFTLPWSDMGARLLPTANFFDYQRVMSGHQNTFQQLVADLEAVYVQRVADAQQQLGDLFVETEYPSPQELSSKFAFRFVISPVPEAGDWRLDVGNAALDALKAEYEAATESKLAETKDYTWGVLKTALEAMVDRLAEPSPDEATAKGTKRFRDSLVSNLLDAVDKLEKFNLTGDPQMADMRQRLSDLMNGVTPDALRNDAKLRAATRDEMARAIAALPGLGWDK